MINNTDTKLCLAVMKTGYKFFREAALTLLQQTVQMCIALEASQKQMLVFRAEKEETAVH